MWRVTAVWAVLAGALWVIGCEKPAAAPPAEPPPPEVGVVKVASRTMPIEFSEIGQTAASRRVEVRARIKGYIAKRHFQEGAKVKEGELLYEIDDREFRVALQQAEAQLVRAQANLDLAERDVARLEPLVRNQSVSRKELDDAEARRKVATGDVASARADIERARLDLSYTRIESPVAGIIGLTLKQEGSFVDEMNNSLLTTALKTDPMHVNFAIPEKAMLRYRNDVLSGKIVIPADNNFRIVIELLDRSVYEREGKLTIVGFEVNPQTGTALFRAELPNPEGVLIDGQFVRVRIQGATRPGAISLPQRAVLMGDQGAYVYVVDNEGKTQIRPVTTGEWSPPEWIIDKGLVDGDVVVVDGVQKVLPGGAVTPRPLAAHAPATAPATGPSPKR